MSRLPCLRVLTLIALVGTACGDSLPTQPTPPTPPQVAITLALRNPGTVSLSEPVACSGDWLTCPKGQQPQGPSTSSAVLIRQFALGQGTYRVTGVLEPGTPAGATVQVHIGDGTNGSTSGGVLRDGLVLGFVAASGQPQSPPSVVTELCGGRFSFDAVGTLEWSVTFRVTDTANRQDELCSQFTSSSR
jgi:hypothetical protein